MKVFPAVSRAYLIKISTLIEPPFHDRI